MQEDIIQTICKDSNYHLALFTADEIEDLRTQIVTKTSRGRDNPLYPLYRAEQGDSAKAGRGRPPALCESAHQAVRLPQTTPKF